MANPELQKYFEEKSRYYDAMTPGQFKASEAIDLDRSKIIDRVDKTKEELAKEANQYERTHTSFFAVAISLIVAGMLSKIPGEHATHATRFFYIGAIMCALLTASFLFMEFHSTKKAFRRWTDHVQEIADYTNSDKWTPDVFNEWIDKHNKKGEEQTPNIFFQAEVVLLSLSFVMLVLWLIEVMVNPNWLIFN